MLMIVRDGRLSNLVSPALMVLRQPGREQVRLDAHGAVVDDVATQVSGGGQQADRYQAHRQRADRRQLSPAAPTQPGHPSEQHDRGQGQAEVPDDLVMGLFGVCRRT